MDGLGHGPHMRHQCLDTVAVAASSQQHLPTWWHVAQFVCGNQRCRFCCCTQLWSDSGPHPCHFPHLPTTHLSARCRTNCRTAAQCTLRACFPIALDLAVFASLGADVHVHNSYCTCSTTPCGYAAIHRVHFLPPIRKGPTRRRSW